MPASGAPTNLDTAVLRFAGRTCRAGPWRPRENRDREMNPEVDRLRHRVTDTLGRALTKWMKGQVGRGPEDVKVYLVDDMILVRLVKSLTPGEAQVATTSDGRHVVREFRNTLLRIWQPKLESLVEETSGAHAIRVYADLDTAADEWILIVVLDRTIADAVRR
jgi:uncharacterized protein YbcI